MDTRPLLLTLLLASGSTAAQVGPPDDGVSNNGQPAPVQLQLIPDNSYVDPRPDLPIPDTVPEAPAESAPEGPSASAGKPRLKLDATFSSMEARPPAPDPGQW